MTPTQREHLELIRKTTGGLRPEDVLEDARNPNSPLHDCFTWDDTVAAAAYRMLQAQAVVKVAVRFLEGPERPVQRARVTIQPQSAPATPEPHSPEAALFRMNLREAEIAVQMHALRQEREYLIAAIKERESQEFSTQRYALDLFVRGVPMQDICEIATLSSVDGTVLSEMDILNLVRRYGGNRPRHWSATLAKQQWDADEGENMGGIFGVPPYRVHTRIARESVKAGG